MHNDINAIDPFFTNENAAKFWIKGPMFRDIFIQCETHV